MHECDIRHRWRDLTVLVEHKLEIPVGDCLRLCCVETMLELAAEIARHQSSYSFPSGPADAYYLPDDRIVILAIGERKPGWLTDFICLHEIGHDVYLHWLPDKNAISIYNKTRKSSQRVRDAFLSIGRISPWRIEERICEIFAAGMCPELPEEYRQLRSCFDDILFQDLVKG